MIIDNHTHITNEQILNFYNKQSSKQVSKIICIPWCNKNSQDVPRIPDIEELLSFTEIHDNLFALGSIDMETDLDKQLLRHEELFKQNKIFGIKLYPGYQKFYPYEDKVVAIAKLCERYDKPLVFHSGDFFDPENVALLKYAHPLHIDDLAKICPNTKIVISHFGFPYYMETANVVAVNENVYTDISALMVEFETKQATKDLEKQFLADFKRALIYFPIIRNKIMFGTDFGGEETCLSLVKPYIDAIKKNMDTQEQKNAFYKLAQKLYF